MRPTCATRLKLLAQQHDTTLYMTMLAAFAVLLMRYSGQRDIPIGTPVVNRPHRELEHVIGFFINTLVLRVQLDENPPFRDLLAHVREVAVGAFDHRDLPFERLVEVLQPERSLSYQPLFQVIFEFENAPTRTLHLPDLTIERHWIEPGTAQVDLALLLEEAGDAITGQWEYACALFDAPTIAQMARHYTTLLQAIAINPDQPIEQIALLDAADAPDDAGATGTIRCAPTPPLPACISLWRHRPLAPPKPSRW
ncbi:MAG: hypothetical protein HC893_15590 [Chloroflexaceae bacterium]|nr:hypothetical protein [Chloroflexaceae bacterium]